MPIEIQFQPTRGLDGILTIREAGQPVIRIDDELWHHLMYLARAVGELCAGYDASIPYSGMPGGYDLRLQGDEVLASGDYIATARYRRDELAHAVLSAADRWLQYAEQVGDPDHQGAASEVVAAVAEVRGALRAPTM